MQMQTVKLGFILHSSAAFDCYMDATGKVPSKMPEGKNTLLTPFEIDDDGVKRAALLVYQTGFGETLEEVRNGDEASGLSVAIALDVPLEQGRNALDEWSRRTLRLDS